MAKNSRQSGGKTNSSSKSTRNKSNAKKEKAKKQWICRIVAIFAIALILGVSLLFEDKINNVLVEKGIIKQPASPVGVVSMGEKLNVHFVDVGQGDACIIELPDEKLMIIDGGKNESKNKLLKYIEDNISDGDVQKFDYAILTHSDEDHCGGLDDVFEKYDVGTFYRPNQLSKPKSYPNFVDPNKNLLKGSPREKDTVAYMRAIETGNNAADKVVVTDARDDTQNLIAPNVSKTSAAYYEINFYTPTNYNYTDDNDYSPIIILEYQSKRITLSGDAEETAEKEFVQLATQGNGRYSIFDDSFSVDVIKLGHHGSKTSSSKEYLEVMTTPANVSNVMVVISSGVGNSYGHPEPEVIARLLALGFSEQNILRTDQMGSILMTVEQDDDDIYQLYYGAVIVKKDSGVPLTWRQIALMIFVTASTIIIVQPLVASAKKRKKI